MKRDYGVVSLNKNIKGGTPCVVGTRIPIRNLFFLHKTKGETPESIVQKHYPQLRVRQVKEAIDWYLEKGGKYG